MFCVCFLLTVRKPLPEAPATLLSHLLDHSCTKCSSPNQWPASDGSLPWGPRKGWYRCGRNSIRKGERDALGMNLSTVTSRYPYSWHCPFPYIRKTPPWPLPLSLSHRPVFQSIQALEILFLNRSYLETSRLLWSWVVSCFSQYSFLSQVLHHCLYAHQCPPSVVVSQVASVFPKLDHELPGTDTMSGSCLSPQRVQLSTLCSAPGPPNPPEFCIK